ncbi:hypothetical protein EVAR_30408_1 [Eumeta japonica]|uniref:Uncharacterized protein n=1 Tax=Eumeta variegata TaxID=151549 RepID=A0A4C1W4L5_EUMVA|nr:hypothetical protein EVAR_30408_1 [Eumeta japonica]
MDGNNAFLRVSFAMATCVKLSMVSRHHTAIWQRSARAALQMKFISHTKSFVSRVEPCRCFSFALLEYSARDLNTKRTNPVHTIKVATGGYGARVRVFFWRNACAGQKKRRVSGVSSAPGAFVVTSRAARAGRRPSCVQLRAVPIEINVTSCRPRRSIVYAPCGLRGRGWLGAADGAGGCGCSAPSASPLRAVDSTRQPCCLRLTKKNIVTALAMDTDKARAHGPRRFDESPKPTSRRPLHLLAIDHIFGEIALSSYTIFASRRPNSRRAPPAWMRSSSIDCPTHESGPRADPAFGLEGGQVSSSSLDRPPSDLNNRRKARLGGGS